MAPPILHLRDIALSFGGTPLLLDAELAVGEGERICVVGRNGSGKSTLLKIAAGQIAPDRGERFLQPGTTLRYLSQEPDLSGFASAYDYVRAGLAPGDDEHRASYLLQQLNLDPASDPAKLSGGEARRAALARVLAPQPDILLLDEPTNHLDLPAIEWLESQLLASRGALVMISHDRRFLERLSRATLWLDRGKTRRLDQGFKDFEAWRDAILEREETEQHKLVRKIAAETEWLHKGVTARRRRNQGRLRALMELRKQRRQQTQATGNVVMTATEGRMSGKLVIEAQAISKAFDGTRVVDGFSVRVMRGDRVGLVGPNGAGKTTLVNMLTGALAPDSGSVRLGANIQLISLDQRRAGLDPDTTLSETLTGGQGDSVTVGGQTKHVISYMKDFLFLPEQARTPLSALSGGERGRLMLARALARPSNLLVLDEPTNDLDLETLDLLQEMLADYQGTVLLVSHDRDFLDRVVTTTIAAEGNGRWTVYAGGYSDMAAQRAESETSVRKADAAPHGQAKRAAARPDTAATAKRKLSFKEKHALETLPAKIAKLEAEVAALRTRLAAPDLYARDRAAFETAAKDLERAEATLATAEDEWLSLEMLRESLQ